jgi:transposase
MTTRRKKQSYSPEFRAEAVRQVIDGSRPIAVVARELGIIEQTLGNWVKAYRDEHAGDEPPLSVPERIRLRETEREVRELRLENEFLKKAALDSTGQRNSAASLAAGVS